MTPKARVTGAPRWHLRPGYIAAVSLGGAIGTGLRYGGEWLVNPVSGWPLGTFVINLLGAFLLAVLMGVLLDLGELSRRQHALRLSVGTGMMGGFTTYSSLAMETTTLLQEGLVSSVALLYPLTSLILGVLASLAGLRLVGILSTRPRG